MSSELRQPIVCVLGHVDSGKTSLLDKIRGTAVASREAGGITQHIGASFFPLATLEKISGTISAKTKMEIKIPGLLVIDTPGHQSFLNLRKRGGSVADIAIVVVDAMKGFEIQTYESIDILRAKKTPFIVAANKIDQINGWKSLGNTSILRSLRQEEPYVVKDLDGKLYAIMGTLSRLGFKSERFDRITDFARNVAIVPVSAKSGEGIAELVTVLIGLTQQFLQETLTILEGPAKGSILEVKEEPGLGLTLNAIIYDGTLHEGDQIVVAGRDKAIVTRVRAIFLPKPLDEIRDPTDRFASIREIHAAAGVKIAAPGLEDVVTGSPIYAVPKNRTPEEVAKIVTDEISGLRIKTDKMGIILKADALGSLEALTWELENNGVTVRLADVGDISRRDVIQAATVKRKVATQGVVLAFNVKILPDAAEEARKSGVPIFKNNVIYHLIEDYLDFAKEEQRAKVKKELGALLRPAKIRIIPGFIIRRNNPAIVGIEVVSGKIRQKTKLLDSDGKEIGQILQIQDKGQAIAEAGEKMQVAISIDDPTVGRQIFEGDTLYVDVPESHVKDLLQTYRTEITENEIKTLEELIQIKRRERPLWAFGSTL
ncbi:MAG TPA: translation initiation factor IF-2 [Candidatus Bathyarchaeia archaeon]|nr:translation initiation factor IF-2 [Candidatus Bathyarchaeia archaeon]